MKNSTKGNNPEIDGYKVQGDGNAPNLTNPPKAENRTFEKNPNAAPKPKSDIPGKEFNLNDKAYHDSSKEDFVKTVSAVHHADQDFLGTDTNDKD